MFKKTLRINRAKMETEKWATKRWITISDNIHWYTCEIRFASPHFLGAAKSKVVRNKYNKRLEYWEKKDRQIKLILDKIGYNWR